MLDIVFGREHVENNFIVDSEYLFNYRKEPKWFQDAFIQRMISEIDNLNLLYAEAFVDADSHGRSSMDLSLDVKTLCCIYYYPDLIFYGSMMSDVCIPFYMELAKLRGITLCFEHCPDIPEHYFESNLVRIGSSVASYADFTSVYDRWCRGASSFNTTLTKEIKLLVGINPLSLRTKFTCISCTEEFIDSIKYNKVGISAISSDFKCVFADKYIIRTSLGFSSPCIIFIEESCFLNSNILNKMNESHHVFVVLSAAPYRGIPKYPYTSILWR